jgi:hypothetical protein
MARPTLAPMRGTAESKDCHSASIQSNKAVIAVSSKKNVQLRTFLLV